ncbi:NEW3 domain-containing protein [Chloroflexota bacterium]
MSKYIKVFPLILSIAALILVLLPGTALAQEEKTEISLRLIYADYDTKVTPDEENTLHLEVHNTGDTAVTNIRLSSELPEDWDIEFSPNVIAYLSADSHKTVNIHITPDKYADRGSHRFRITAESNETKEIITAYVRIDTATSIWTWIGVAVGCLVIAGFIIVFRRFGKQ